MSTGGERFFRVLVPGRALQVWRIRAASRQKAADRVEHGEGELVETRFARRTTKAAGYTVIEDSLRPGRRDRVWDR
jgi:hypothetical protein